MVNAGRVDPEVEVTTENIDELNPTAHAKTKTVIIVLAIDFDIFPLLS